MTTTEPPADGTFETKDNRPGYRMAELSAPEHGEHGFQPGYSNSPGRDGDDENDTRVADPGFAGQPKGKGDDSKAAPKRTAPTKATADK